MAYYAVLDENNIVTKVKSAGDENDWDGEKKWLAETGLVHKRTSFNTRGGVHYKPNTAHEPSDDQSKAFRKNYAGIGYTFDEVRDAFISPQPFDSWTLNEETCRYEPPSPMPLDGKVYTWNEGTTSWDEVSE